MTTTTTRELAAARLRELAARPFPESYRLLVASRTAGLLEDADLVESLMPRLETRARDIALDLVIGRTDAELASREFATALRLAALVAAPALTGDDSGD